MSERIMLVEDETAIADAVAWTLTSSGYDVDVLQDGETALKATPDDYDLLVLDVMLPRVSGIEVCRRVRARSAVPILMLTARSGEIDRVLGLEAGADDYVPKPFSMPELLSRVRALLRRRALDRQDAATGLRRAGTISVDLVEQSVQVEGRPVDLTPSEFRLLAQLASDPGRAFTRKELATRLTRRNGPSDERACDVHVKNIRRKLERDPGRPLHLVTVRGVGYMLRAV
jgi:DNA-binding response OmpR family regulator